MCGVIGIISKRDVAQGLYYGLLALQHRGQDAAGVLIFNKDKIFLKKGVGLVQDVLNEADSVKVNGNFGIGHTRYPTAGSNSERDAHPFIISSKPTFGIVENGNLTNYHEIKNGFRKRGIFLSSNSDAEAILNILATNFENSRDILKSFKELINEVKGSYSIIVAIENYGLIAFRDPNGFKPLVLGKDNSSFIFASESVALQSLGYRVIRELNPGELIMINENLEMSSEAIKVREHSHCMFEWVYFARPDSVIENRSVYEVRLNLGRELAKRWNNKMIDVVMPVPDTARAAALAFAESLHLKYRECLIKNRYIARTFIMSTQRRRDEAVMIKLNPIIAEVKGKKIALLDDSIVRGTTSKKIVKLIKDAGAKEVHFISTCPEIKYPCFYGIDMSTREELIAANASPEEISKIINANSVTYQTIEGLKNAIGLNDLCMACLTGNYPTKITNQALLSEYRRNERENLE